MDIEKVHLDAIVEHSSRLDGICEVILVSYKCRKPCVSREVGLPIDSSWAQASEVIRYVAIIATGAIICVSTRMPSCHLTLTVDVVEYIIGNLSPDLLLGDAFPIHYRTWIVISSRWAWRHSRTYLHSLISRMQRVSNCIICFGNYCSPQHVGYVARGCTEVYCGGVSAAPYSAADDLLGSIPLDVIATYLWHHLLWFCCVGYGGIS